MAAIIYWVPILFPITLAAFSRGQSRVRVEYSIARAFTGCAAVVAAGRTRADGGSARQADRGRRESCVVLRGFCQLSLALGRRGRVDEQGNRGGLSGAGYRLRAESGKSRGAARARVAVRGRTDAVLPQIVRRTYLCHRDHAAALITPAKPLRAVAAGRRRCSARR
jgi:hypothetical protein